MSCKDAQIEIECALGLLVTNMENDGNKQKKKASWFRSYFNIKTCFYRVLKELKAQKDAAEEYKCPLCGNNCEEIAENDTRIIEAAEWLEKELTITERYTSDFFEDIRKLEELHSNIASQIKEVWKQEFIMKINFSNINNSYNQSSTHPRDIFMALPNKSKAYEYPRDVQTEV